jgi:REP element-mobilizing transposase RayT
MKRERVSIATDLRQFVATAVAEKLGSVEIQVLIVSVDARHLHLLGRFHDHAPRAWVGKAKKHSSHLLRQGGLRTEEGGLWARRTRADPIRDRAHQLNVFGYILRHREKGAAVWRFDRAKPHDIR